VRGRRLDEVRVDSGGLMGRVRLCGTGVGVLVLSASMADVVEVLGGADGLGLSPAHLMRASKSVSWSNCNADLRRSGVRFITPRVRWRTPNGRYADSGILQSPCLVVSFR
jgi:hypothetical protein